MEVFDPKKDIGKPISKLRTAKDLSRKLDELQRSRSTLENQWRVNLAFYRGQQYTWYNKKAQRLESLPLDDGDKPRYRVRLVSNQIMVGSNSLLAKLTKTKPNMFATPGSSSDSDVKAAQLAERLLEHWWTSLDLSSKMKEAILWGIISSAGYWKISWDDQAGKEMRFTVDPNGQPILDDSLKDAYLGELKKIGQQPEQTVVYVGELDIQTMSPLDVFLDPSAKTFEDAKYAICLHYMDPDEVKTRWGVDLEPDSISKSPDAILPFSNSEQADHKTVRKVAILYHIPSPAIPNGRYVVWSGEHMLEDKSWYLPFQKLPLVKFPGVRVPGSVYDSSVVEQAIPLQKELNRTLSQIVEYKNLTLKPRYWAPVGSVERRGITTEPGTINFYNPMSTGQMKPEPEALPSMPNYVFNHLENISARLNDIFSLREVTEGQVPPNVEAAIAIDLLQEMATDKIAPVVQDIEGSLARAGTMMLSLAQEYYKEPRLIKVVGTATSSQIQKFTSSDIQGEIDVSVESGSGLPRTRAGRLARIQELMKMQLITPQKAWKHFDLADMKSIAAKFQVDEDQAYREHDKMNQHIPLNASAVQQAMMQVNQGLNPETGQPLTPQDDPQQILLKASLQPEIANNHEIHLDTHASFMNSPEYENLPQDVQQNYVTHYSSHMEILQSLPMVQGGDPPRVSLQVKSAASPSVQSKILERAGVQVTPQESAEPPIETWVSDSKDKPNVDDRPTGDQQLDMENQKHENSLGLELWKAILQGYVEKQKAAATPSPTKGVKPTG